MKKKLLLKLLSMIVVIAACSQAASPVSRDDVPDLSGTYTSSIARNEFKSTVLPRRLGGRWTLTLAGGEYVLEGPMFRVTEELDVLDDETVAISGMPAPGGAFNCVDEDGDRITPPTEVRATYAFEHEGDALAFTQVEDPCSFRGLFLERTWTVRS